MQFVVKASRVSIIFLQGISQILLVPSLEAVENIWQSGETKILIIASP